MKKIIWSRPGVGKSKHVPRRVPVEEREFVIGCEQCSAGEDCKQCASNRDELLNLFRSGEIVTRKPDA